MTQNVKHFAEWSASLIELIGITLIVIFVVYALTKAFIQLMQKRQNKDLVSTLRKNLAQGILLGLELLVAADIIHTVAVDFDFQSVGTLAVIVIIRTFLSFTMEVELTGKWPWNKAPTKHSG